MVHIAVIVTPFDHVSLTAVQRINDKLIDYSKKGFKINRSQMTATNGELRYHFIPDIADTKERRLNGGYFDDIIDGTPLDNLRISRR